MNNSDLYYISNKLLKDCRRATLHLATAESCTGGMIAAALTAIAGSSDVFERGFVTYSNEAKAELLGVPMALIVEHGAVSEPVARAMAEGAVARSAAQVSLSVTGIAGPGGATPTKPVGLVFLGAARRGAETLVERHVFDGDRGTIRHAAALAGLALLSRRIG
ncbi:MAG: CinA family protein [Rhodospirillaceae bacterium]|jgi:nicotinamide-nucleotide amidase|nr:CinA family protein [Rhodospirillaceae bacterium]MBT6119117.1 CinA family protein [Rhodospirillaceae bacterium]